MTNFSELNLSPVLRDNLQKHSFVEPTPVQAKSIPTILDGHDVVATAQTGTGKTLAFVLPLLESLTRAPKQPGVRAVILSPTRELAIQIDETFRLIGRGTGFRSAVVVGGLNENTQLQNIRKGAQVLIATPGRLCDFLERKLVNLGNVGYLVLDEGDRMLDMGFLPAIELILSRIPNTRQTLFFSATIEPQSAKLVNKYLKNPVRIETGSIRKPTENVDLHVYEVEADRKLSLLQLLIHKQQGSFLVFARTKRGVDRLARKLATGGVNATAIHGDRTQNQRNRALQGFQKGEFRVLVATDVAARGIHVDGIAHVVNYDLPMVPEDFIHRVGRTGRAGARGVASTFGTPAERSGIRDIERALRIQLTRLPVADDLVAEPRREMLAAAPMGGHSARPPKSPFTSNRRKFSRY